MDDPGEKPVKSRKMVQAMMKQPMKVLSLSANGDLIIPDEAETQSACNATFDEQAADQISKWRKQYPRPKVMEKNRRSTEA